MMIKSTKNFHRFMLQQALYPLLLCTGLSMGIFAFRYAYSHRWVYANLPWNLILAWIPYILSLVATGLNQLIPGKLWPWKWILLAPLTALWLLFFPNAPYLVTDFYHLTLRPPLPLWYDIGMIASYAFTGCFLAIASLRSMQRLVQENILPIWPGKMLSWLFVIISLGLSGLGVYLGRFERFNSWDFFFHPRLILSDIALRIVNPMDNLRFIGFSLMFTAILLMFYLMYVVFHPGIGETPPKNT